ncbi:hypothetical protein ABZ891_18015 [Streptomyces sp. NPDC047023]|uniref:hypothetical protein n=1 Tax=Streptomyces sp. NPDC047023 TaxID=3155139 RepID=UPI0033F053FC
MTDRAPHDYGDQGANNRLGRHKHTLDVTLDGILDIEAGLREILIGSRHDAAVDALGTALDVEAGLASILPPTAQHQTSDATSTHHHPRAAGLLALSPAGRMALRDHPDVKEDQNALQRALCAVLEIEGVPSNERSRVLALAFDLAQHLDGDLDCALNGDLDGGPGLIGVLSDLDGDLGFAASLIRILTRTHELVRSLVHDLSPDLSPAVDFVPIPGLQSAHLIDFALARSRAIALGLDLDLDLYFGRACDRARDLARILATSEAGTLIPEDFIEIRTNEVCRAIGLALDREAPVLDSASVLTLLNDFTHDDLRNTTLRALNLSGVRWSPYTTQWPPGVDIEALKARSDETPPGSGIWIVRSGTTVRDFADLT